MAQLYVEVRARAATDPAGAWELWRAEREALYRDHPQSPVPAAERDAFRAHHWPYDDRLRATVAVDAGRRPRRRASRLAPLALPNSGAESPAFDRIGTVRLPLPDGGGVELPLFWMRGYTGGLFLPFGDATNGAETYGAGRYLLDGGEERGPRRRRGRRHARRRPQLRVPALVRLRPAVGVPARAAREPGRRSASRPASGCADRRPRPALR